MNDDTRPFERIIIEHPEPEEYPEANSPRRRMGTRRNRVCGSSRGGHGPLVAVDLGGLIVGGLLTTTLFNGPIGTSNDSTPPAPNGSSQTAVMQGGSAQDGPTQGGSGQGGSGQATVPPAPAVPQGGPGAVPAAPGSTGLGAHAGPGRRGAMASPPGRRGGPAPSDESGTVSR